MSAPVVDQSEPLDMEGVSVRMRHDRQEAFCSHCGGWLLLDNYRAQRIVMRQINHVSGCEALTRYSLEMSEKYVAELANFVREHL